jgi:HAE1 family hydrophobic/amphiphilic exporter-1
LHLSLRIAGEFESLDDIRQTDIARPGRSAIRIADVAEVLDTIKELEGVTLLGEEPVVSVLIYKEPDANTILVSEELDRALAVVSEDYADFKYQFVYRDAEYVKASFIGLRQSLLIGAVLALVVLFVFLGNVRSPLVVGLAIPISIVITFALLFFGKVKLNLMSLGGLSLAAGMLVDNSIVVLENISRHLAEASAKIRGKGLDSHSHEAKRIVAACSETGGREMARPVMAATLTTIAVFFPVVYVPGIAGAFFRDQALTVTFSLTVSIAAALLLQPVLSSRVLRLTSGPPRGLFRLFAAGLDAMHSFYHRMLVGVLKRRPIMVLLLLVGLAGTGLLASRLNQSFMPERSSGNLRLDLELPAGTPLQQMTDVVATIASLIGDDDAVLHVFSQVGQTERTLAALQDYTATHTARIRIILKPMRHAYEQGLRLQRQLTQSLSAMPEVLFAFREEGIGLGEVLSVSEAPFTMGVMAENANTALAVAEELFVALADVEGLVDLHMDRVLGSPNLVVRLNRPEILRAGLDPDVVAREMRNRIAGVEATTFNEVEQRIDIAVRFEQVQRQDLSAALASPVQVAGGRTVPLHAFLDMREERPVRELVRRNQRRMVTISGDIQGRSAEDISDDAVAISGKLDIPGDVTFESGGEREAMRKSFMDLGWAMLLAVLLVYMILAAQFESFLDPLIIAAVIPIGLAGAAIAIGITGNSINMMSLIGILALLGIAVNDAIVKVDTMRSLQAEGMAGFDAIMQASKLRFRPILMTSATTVLAMLPMAIGLGSGEQLQRPLAITIIGGLTMTTFLTLLYTPVLYSLAPRIPGGRS